jgi:hypothetical protein
MIAIECFKGLPIEYESFLIEKYDSYFTTCRYIEVYYPAYDINYMLVSENGKLIELIVFGNNENTSSCFNLLVNIDQDIITKCIKKIFEIYPSTQKIKIDASYKKYTFKKAILYSSCNDHILSLPTTMDDYYLELGHHIRKHIKNHKVKLLRDYPSVRFVTKYGVEIEEVVINKIIQLNQERMKQKGIIFGEENHVRNKIYQYSQHYGCVAYIEIDGVIVAGFIATILNKRIFGEVIAHDNNFNKYNPGEMCTIYLIQTAIEKGMSTFHFLWGENEFKDRLLAKPRPLFSYFIYRTYSLNYISCRVKSSFYRFLISVRLSKFAKPFRDVIKSFRKRYWRS